MSELSNKIIEPGHFRETLAQFPTGVVIITAMIDGAPVGMVVGSFTSVSLDPPLVAFLPSKTSSTYQKLKNAQKYCVNVLSVDQENLCRVFASKAEDKFTGVSWSISKNGLPKISNAVAWIEFSKTETVEAGDHDIVIGEVIALESGESISPLLFFQGGYGGFRSRSRVAPFANDMRLQLQVADVARGVMEDLSEDLGFECFAQAIVDGDLTIVAGAGGADGVKMQIGRRLPFIAPYGTVFMASDSDQGSFLGWLKGLAASEQAQEQYRKMLARVSSRGWSLALTAPNHEEVWQRVAELTSIAPTPAQEREISALLVEIAAYYEPEQIKIESNYNPRIIVAPVFKNGNPVLGIALFGFPDEVSGAQILEWADRLKNAAAEITARL